MWDEGTITIDGTTYQYYAKVYDMPSKYGIDGGRISKLEVYRMDQCKRIIHYEREWITRRPKKDSGLGQVLDGILQRYPIEEADKQD